MSDWYVLTVEITSASVPDFLTVANHNDISFSDIRYLDDLRVRMNVAGSDFKKLDRIANRRGDSLKIVNKRGAYFAVISCMHRPVLLAGILLWLIMVLYLPSRVLFIRVEGNQSVDSAMVIEAAEKCGIHFGASRRYVRSEKVKNMLLSEIDSLQWIGVNTYGCVASISVKERSASEKTTPNYMVNNIVAARDGIITEITVVKGTQICKVGQAVREGQILVSGYTDCGLSVKAEKAEAEILALTNRRISAVTLSTGMRRTKQSKNQTRYSIQIGKNIVKLYNDSGISDMSCVKIYEQRYLELPGGFELPLSLIKETLQYYEQEEVPVLNSDGFPWIKQATEAYLRSVMISGKILSGNVSSELLGDVFCQNGIYTCEEIIGQVRIEEIGEHNGERNR